MHPGGSWAGTLTALAAASLCALGAAPAAADVLPADVSVSIAAAPDVAVAGSDLTYTIAVTNAGPFDAQDVSVTTTVPPGTTLRSLSGPGFTCADLTCSASTLPAASTAPITLVVSVDPSTPALSWLTGTAAATTSSLDLVGANDSSSATTPVVTVADLSSSVTQVSPDPVVAGSDVTYRLALHNAGPSDAEGARISMPVPAGTSLASVTQVGGPEFTCATARISCSRERMAPGGDALFDVVLHTGSGAVVAKPLAFAVTTDPDHSNDEASVTTAVAQPPAPDPDPVPSPDPDPVPTPDPPDTPQQVITLGNAVEGAGSGTIFVPVSCVNEAVGMCKTTVTVTFRKPHDFIKRIKRRLTIGTGQTSVAFMSGSTAQRKKIRVIRRLKITVTATNPPGPPVKRDSVLSGHPKPAR